MWVGHDGNPSRCSTAAATTNPHGHRQRTTTRQHQHQRQRQHLLLPRQSACQRHRQRRSHAPVRSSSTRAGGGPRPCAGAPVNRQCHSCWRPTHGRSWWPVAGAGWWPPLGTRRSRVSHAPRPAQAPLPPRTHTPAPRQAPPTPSSRRHRGKGNRRDKGRLWRPAST